MKKMTDRNPHTGEKLQSKRNSDKFRENFDKIFRDSLDKPKANEVSKRDINLKET